MEWGTVEEWMFEMGGGASWFWQKEEKLRGEGEGLREEILTLIHDNSIQKQRAETTLSTLTYCRLLESAKEKALGW
jgi:hypothetical protein